MAWWDDIYNAVVTAVETVADTVEGVINAVAEVVADVVESLGNAAQDGLNALGGGAASGTGGAFCAWLGGVIAGITNLVAVTIKGFANVIGGTIAGSIRFGTGILLFNMPLIIRGISSAVSANFGPIITQIGAIVSLTQATLGIQNNSRPLTNEEKALLNNVFRKSLSLYNIRIITGRAGLLGINKTTFTLNNTIYFNNGLTSADFKTLVHECVHVWQYQNLGTQYISNAIGAQFIYGRKPGGIKDAYDWTAELARRGIKSWKDFNGEAQATLIAEIWDEGILTRNGQVSKGNGVYYSVDECKNSVAEKGGTCVQEFVSSRDGKNYTTLADASIDILRKYWNVRISGSFYP